MSLTQQTSYFTGSCIKKYVKKENQECVKISLINVKNLRNSELCTVN